MDSTLIFHSICDFFQTGMESNPWDAHSFSGDPGADDSLFSVLFLAAASQELEPVPEALYLHTNCNDPLHEVASELRALTAETVRGMSNAGHDPVVVQMLQAAMSQFVPGSSPDASAVEHVLGVIAPSADCYVHTVTADSRLNTTLICGPSRSTGAATVHIVLDGKQFHLLIPGMDFLAGVRTDVTVDDGKRIVIFPHGGYQKY